MKKYSWLISLAFVSIVALWLGSIFKTNLLGIKNTYGGELFITRYIDTCGVAKISEGPFGKPNIEWEGFCGTAGSSNVYYYLELEGDYPGFTAHSATSEYVSSKRIRISFFEKLKSVGLNNKYIFYTTRVDKEMLWSVPIFWGIVALLVWGFFYLAINSVLDAREIKAIRKKRAARRGGMEN